MTEPLNRALLAKARRKMEIYAFEEARGLLSPFQGADTGISVSGNALTFWREAAETLGEAGMCEEAEQAWSRAQKAGVASNAAETEIVYAHLLSGRAEEILPRARGLSLSYPANSVIRNLHALALFESGAIQEALREWEASKQFSAQMDCPLSTNPQYLSLGAMAVEGYFLRRRKETQDLFSSGSLEPQPLKGNRRNRMAEIEKAWEQGHYEKALVWVEAELDAKANPDRRVEDQELQMLRALVLGSMARWDEARQQTAAVLSQSPDNPGAQTYLAYTLINSGEPKLGLAVLDKVPPAGPDDYFANYIRGCGWLALGDRPRSAQAFRTAFSCYFFDSYHSVLVPAWKRMLRVAEIVEGTAGRCS